MILIKHQKGCSSFQPSARLDDGQISVNAPVRSLSAETPAPFGVSS